MSLSKKKKISVLRSKKLSQSPRGELSDSDTTSLARFRLKKSKPSVIYAFDALKSQTILKAVEALKNPISSRRRE